MSLGYYIEEGHYQIKKDNEYICGDVCTSSRLAGEGRVISVLADGLGSGVKAAVLATLTSTMAAKFASSNIDIRKAAEIIMSTLPICSIRKIGYSTFTIIDNGPTGEANIIEHDNPPYLLIRGGELVNVPKERIELMSEFNGRKVYLMQSKMQLQLEDRLVVFSDGVSQAGTGNRTTPAGQGQESVVRLINEQITARPQLSATQLATAIVKSAYNLDDNQAKDDITCKVIYLRNPRRTVLLSGPPYEDASDRELATYLNGFVGQKIICGGTTASIIARELGRTIEVNTNSIDDEVPPDSTMPGIDLITEGILTLSKLLTFLQEERPISDQNQTIVERLAYLLLESDIIEFMVGSKINMAHHDPKLPYELEMRRTVVRTLGQILESRYLKSVKITFI